MSIRPEDLNIGRLFWLIRDAVLVGDAASGRIILWNPAAEQMFGYSEAEAVGQPIEILVPQQLKASHRAGLAHFNATGRGRLIDAGTPIELPAVRKTGEECWIELSLNPIHGPTPERRLVLAVIRDATARRQAEAERRERARAEALAADRSAILDQVAEGVIIADAEGRITFVNAAARTLHGAAVLGVPVESYSTAYGLYTLAGQPYPPEDLPLARAARRGETVRDVRWRIRRPDGREVIAEGSASPVCAMDGTRLGSVLVVRDVSAQAALEREKDDFLAAVSHDLKSPLASVRTLAQLLRRGLARSEGLAPEHLDSRLQSIEEATTRMARLLDELVDLARLGMDRPLELDLRPTDLVALARTAVEERDGATEQHHLRLEAVEPELVGHWDATRLERVLSNLLDNALKYSPAGGDVVLRVCRETQGEVAWAVLEVSDQGVGIPAAEHARIFERFGRAKNVVGRIPGTGIGLAAVRQIVQQLGGTIDVESVEGVGSTFRVRLPLQASPLDGATSS